MARSRKRSYTCFRRVLRAVGDDSCARAARTALRRLEVGDVGLQRRCCCSSGGGGGVVGEEEEEEEEEVVVSGKGKSGGGRSVRRRLCVGEEGAEVVGVGGDVLLLFMVMMDC